jgi:ribosomal protein S18 acetylase RimI-like enzyme
MNSKKSGIKSTLSIATALEADSICELVNSAYRGESSKKGWTTEADFLGGQRVDAEGIRETIATRDRFILLLRSQETNSIAGKIVACVSLDFSLEANSGKDRSCYLGMLTVDPGLQNHGIGKLLMLEAERFAKDRGARKMVISVIQLRTELVNWYVRHGYRPTGQTKPFPYGDLRFGEPKREDLHFLVFEKPL